MISLTLNVNSYINEILVWYCTIRYEDSDDDRDDDKHGDKDGDRDDDRDDDKHDVRDGTADE